MSGIIQPFDIVTIEGSKWSPVTWAIKVGAANSFNETHSVVVRDCDGRIFDPTVGGVKDHNLSAYAENTCYLLRYRWPFNNVRLMEWAVEKQKASKGYDYLSWLGFATHWKALQDEDKWYCSEFCYWLFQDNGYKLTNRDIVFCYPGELTNNTNFGVLFHGKVKEIL